jgi:hypothetical protein
MSRVRTAPATVLATVAPWIRLVLCLATAGLAACAHLSAAPPPAAGPDGAALFRDLQRLVSVRGARGWQIDRLAVADLEGDALHSTCRTRPEAREALLSWVDAELVRRGGPVEKAWLREERRLGRIRDLLELTRIRMVLAHAVGAAPLDCPFWLEPDGGFRGLQIADDRFQLVLEGGGRLIALRTGHRTDLSAGGAGRVLVGRSFGRRLGVLVGAELTGSAELPRDGDGDRTRVVFALDIATPLVLRWRLVNSFFEVAGGPLVHLTELDTRPIPGVHASVAFGVRALRERFVIPGVAIALAYERTLPADRRPALTLLKIGLRVALDIDL